jgi:hypothetical protein
MEIISRKRGATKRAKGMTRYTGVRQTASPCLQCYSAAIGNPAPQADVARLPSITLAVLLCVDPQ